MSAAIPGTYADWRRCIEVDCGIALTSAFIGQRLAALSQTGADEPMRFASLYGDAHLQRVIGWFGQARAERSLAQ